MAKVDMSRVQLWQPPILSKRQEATAPQWNNTSIVTSSRSRPAQQDLQRNEAGGGQGMEYDSFDATLYDDEKNDASDYFPTINEILNSTWCNSIWSEKQHGPEDRESFNKHILNQSTASPDLIQSIPGCGTSSYEGTWDRPVVLDDDDTDITDTEDETMSTFSNLDTAFAIQDTFPHNTQLVRAIANTSEAESPASLSHDIGGDLDGNHTLKDVQGLSTQSESLVQTCALSQPSSLIYTIEPPCNLSNEQSYSPNYCSQSEDERSSPSDALQDSKEHLQEKQQGWEKRNRRADGYNEGDTEDLQRREDNELTSKLIVEESNELTSELIVEESNEQQTLKHMAREVGEGIGDRLYEASDEDDEDPRPAKRRRTILPSYQFSPPTGQDSLQSCLERSRSQSSLVSTRDEAGITHSHSQHTSRGGSPTELTERGGAEYHEWGLQHAFLKRTSIDGQTVFTLEFSLQDLRDLVALQASSHVPLETCRTKSSARTTHSYHPTTKMKKGRPSQQQRGQRCPFTTDEDAKLIDLKENHCLPWKDIALQFPGRSWGTLSVRYCTKLKDRKSSSKDNGDSEG